MIKKRYINKKEYVLYIFAGWYEIQANTNLCNPKAKKEELRWSGNVQGLCWINNASSGKSHFFSPTQNVVDFSEDSKIIGYIFDETANFIRFTEK